MGTRQKDGAVSQDLEPKHKARFPSSNATHAWNYVRKYATNVADVVNGTVVLIILSTTPSATRSSAPAI